MIGEKKRNRKLRTKRIDRQAGRQTEKQTDRQINTEIRDMGEKEKLPETGKRNEDRF